MHFLALKGHFACVHLFFRVLHLEVISFPVSTKHTFCIIDSVEIVMAAS